MGDRRHLRELLENIEPSPNERSAPAAYLVRAPRRGRCLGGRAGPRGPFEGVPAGDATPAGPGEAPVAGLGGLGGGAEPPAGERHAAGGGRGGRGAGRGPQGHLGSGAARGLLHGRGRLAGGGGGRPGGGGRLLFVDDHVVLHVGSLVDREGGRARLVLVGAHAHALGGRRARPHAHVRPSHAPELFQLPTKRTTTTKVTLSG